MSSGSISIDDLRALVDTDPQRALTRRGRGSAPASRRRRRRRAAGGSSGSPSARLGDTRARPRRRWRRRPSWRTPATTAALHGPRHDQPRVRGRPRRRPRRRAAPARLRRAATSTAPTSPALADQRGMLLYRLGRLDAAVDVAATARRLAAAEPATSVDGAAGARQPRRRRVAAAVRSTPRREHLLEAVDHRLRARPDLAGARCALANLAYVETTRGQPARGARRLRRRPRTATAAPATAPTCRGSTPTTPWRSPTPTSSTTPSTSSTAPSSCRRRAGNDLELAELLLVSAEIDLAKGKPDEAHVSAVERGRRVHPPGPRQLAARRRAAAPAGRGPADAGRRRRSPTGLVMNGRALAAGGWRSDALASTLLAALLHAEHGRLDDARALLAEVGPAAARGRGADQLLLGRVAAMLAERSGRSRRGAPGRHGRAARGGRRRRPRSARWRLAPTPPTTAPS